MKWKVYKSQDEDEKLYYVMGFFDPGCENIERAWYTIVERRPDLKIVIGSDGLGFINFESAERAQKYLDNHAELFNLIEDKDFE